MSAKLSLTITNPASEPLEVVDHFYIGTFRIKNYRVLIEISRPNLRDIVDINAELLDRKDTDAPGAYLNAVIFGFGIHLTAYNVN